MLTIAVACATGAQAAGEEPPPTALETMTEQAAALRDFVTSDVAGRFLDMVPALPPVPEVRVAWHNRATGDAISDAEAVARPDSLREGYERVEMDERFYYFTRYGTPLAFVRPLDLLGGQGLASLDGARIADFGFGSVGQLRLLAAAGADAHGIEVDPLLRLLYAAPADTGPVVRHAAAGPGPDGHVRLHFGRFPAEAALVREVGDGYDVFVSKNTLKNGYIHPAEPVDPRMLVDLGVDDATFVRAVHDLLRPGGLFLIYNLSPAPSTERYIPWADGRCPFSRELLESAGFTIVAFDRDDTDAAREMGRRLGWGEHMDLETDLFGTYTLAVR